MLLLETEQDYFANDIVVLVARNAILVPTLLAPK